MKNKQEHYLSEKEALKELLWKKKTIEPHNKKTKLR